MDSYLQKLSKLPPEVRDYFNSYYSIDLNLLICKRNNIAGEEIGLNTDLISSLFFKEFPLEDLTAKIKEVLKFNDVKAKKLAADIAGIRLLVVDKWFGGKIGDYLKSLGVISSSEYQKFAADQVEAVKKEKAEEAADAAALKAEKEKLAAEEPAPVAAEPAADLADFKLDWAKEREEVENIFKDELTEILSSSDVQEELNDVLVYLLLEKDSDLSDVLVKFLLGNNERLTEKPLILGGRQVSPTIANWLSYFIKEKGTAMFDNIVLTDFLVKSANAKLLKEEEKNTVKKLIILYRNLKFFPASMPNQTGEGWEVIPVGLENESGRARTVEAPVTNDVIIKSAKMIAAEKAAAEEREKKIEELKQLLTNYPTASLGRMAVESEIKKLEKKLEK